MKTTTTDRNTAPTPDHTLELRVQIDVRDDRTIDSVAHAVAHLITTADLSALDDLGQVTVAAAPTSCWAAYVASSYGSEISLHLTARAALDAVIAGLGLQEHETDEGRAVSDMDEEALRTFLDDYCSSRADDWDVQEVELP